MIEFTQKYLQFINFEASTYIENSKKEIITNEKPLHTYILRPAIYIL